MIPAVSNTRYSPAVGVENAPPAALDPRTLADCLYADLATASVLNRRHDALVIRLNIAPSQTTVVKLWVRPGLRGFIRRLTRTASAIREWRTLDCLHRARAAVPKPYACLHLASAAAPYTDPLFIEDLGPCEVALEYVKALFRQGQHDRLSAFEDDVITLTDTIIRAGIVDTDHSLVNTVVPAGGKPVRIDFELAQRVFHPAIATRLYGEMLGRLVGTYAFAVQPDVSRVVPFAERLQARVQAPARVLCLARSFAERMLDDQRREKAIDTRIDLGW